MKLVRTIALLLLIIVGSVTTASAEGKNQASNPTLFHVPPKAIQLPFPGYQMSLTVSLKGTRDSERPLKAVIVRDGKLLEMSLPQAKYNALEEPTYTFQFDSPLGDILYQFVLTNPDGTFSLSERFYVRRSCIPETALAKGISPEVTGDARFDSLVEESTLLEQDIARYEKIIYLLKSIKDKLPKKGS